MENTKHAKKYYVLMHLLLFMYSLGGIASKLTASQKFLSPKFFLFYGIYMANLIIYAIFWQKVLKHIRFTTAYANKAVTLIWGSVWGFFCFHEDMSLKKILGICLILLGVWIVVKNDE